MDDRQALATPAAALTLDGMRRDIAEAIGTSPSAVADDHDLVTLGLDSIGVMKLASIWSNRGVDISFGDLIELRTLEGWWQLVSSRIDSAQTPALAAELDESAPFDLATMQHAYWMGRRADQSLGVGCHYYFEFDGRDIEPGRLEAAVWAVLERHGMLRARVMDDGRQQILERSAWRGLRVHDFRTWPAVETGQALEAIRHAESHRRLDVEHGEGFDIQLSQLPDGATRVHINIDMLVADALSFRILIDELAQRYANPDAAWPRLEYSYAQIGRAHV